MNKCEASNLRIHKIKCPPASCTCTARFIRQQGNHPANQLTRQTKAPPDNQLQSLGQSAHCCDNEGDVRNTQLEPNYSESQTKKGKMETQNNDNQAVYAAVKKKSSKAVFCCLEGIEFEANLFYWLKSLVRLNCFVFCNSTWVSKLANLQMIC